MPGGDGTGPMGAGPMTGRAAGYCAGYATPGFANGGGRGQGFFGRMFGGLGFGRGRRNRFYATGLTGWQRAGMAAPAGPAAWGPYATTPTKEQELEILKQQAAQMEDSLAEIRRRTEELSGSDK